MNLFKFLRTSNFRLIIIYASFFAVSSLLVFGVQYWLISDALNQQVVELVNGELASLVKNPQTRTFKNLKKEIEKRTTSRKYPTAYYILQNGDGKKLAGNLPALTPHQGWDEVLAPFSGFSYDGDIPDNNVQNTVMVKGVFLPNGQYLGVGYSTYQINNPLEIIREFFFWSMGLIFVLAFAGGALVSVGFLRKIDKINYTVDAIIEGRLSERIPSSKNGDELDILATNINHMLDRIQILMDSLHHVSNNIAHDLRSPLGRMRQRLITAKASALNVSEYEDVVDHAVQDIDAVLIIFGSLLRIANIEAKSRNASFAPIDLSALLQSMHEAYLPVAEDINKQLMLNVSEDIYIQGDRDLLTQMFANLIENALTHTSPGTTIQINLDQNLQGPILDISDNGLGISARESDKIFERFYQVDQSATAPGNGLGLALVKAVVDLHEASIVLLDNNPGAKFSIQFRP